MKTKPRGDEQPRQRHRARGQASPSQRYISLFEMGLLCFRGISYAIVEDGGTSFSKEYPANLSGIEAEYGTTVKRPVQSYDTAYNRLAQDDLSPRLPRMPFCPPFALEHQRTRRSNHNACDHHRQNRNTRLDAQPSTQAIPVCNFWAGSQAESARNAVQRRRFGRRSRQRTTSVENRPEAQDPRRNRRPLPAKPSRTRGRSSEPYSADAGATRGIAANTPPSPVRRAFAATALISFSSAITAEGRSP